MKSALALCLPVIVMFASPASSRSDEMNPVADPAAVVVSGKARFTILTPGLVRMEWSEDGRFEDRPSFAFINRRLPVPKFEQANRQGILVISTEKLSIRYRPGGKFDKAGLTVQIHGEAGQPDIECAPPFANPTNLGGTTRTLDGISGACPLEEGLLCRNGWTCVDDSKRLLLAPGDWPWAMAREKKETRDWYFFAYGHDYKNALADFIKVAGRIPMPPRFAFGAWWSRYWAYSDAELRQLVKDFRAHDVPLDVLVVDMDWHLDGWTGYTWNPKYFPDPQGFLNWVHEQGLKVTLNLHPADGVGKHEKQFPEMCKAMGLDPAKTARVPFDCTDRKFVDAYFNVLHHPLEKAGIDFWWMDWQQGQQTKIEGLDPLFWLNYLHWTDMERRAGETGRRPMIFSRWGGLGNHRYQIGFSGDTFCNWPSLAFQPPFTATAGNVGYAYWSHDIGGHQPGKVDPEMYVRWLQWGALSPILRTHTTKNPEAERRIWKFPTEFFEAGRKAYQLRYQLIPYIYSAARQCYDTGLPICRPLYYEWPDLNEAYSHGGEYLFGDQMLVAPVAEPADPISKCAMVQVWLPPGRWTNWFSGRTYEGPKTIPLVVPLDEIPIFVKSGGIVVTAEGRQAGTKVPDENLVVHVFPGESGDFTLYEDDGVSADYPRSSARTRISVRSEAGKKRITIGAVEGSYSGMPASRKFSLRLPESPPSSAILVNGAKFPVPSAKAADAATPLVTVFTPPAKQAKDEMVIVVESADPVPAATSLIDAGAGERIALLDSIARENLPGMDKLREQVGRLSSLKTQPGEWFTVAEQSFAAWPAFLKEIRESSMPDADKARLTTRLLGLFYRLNVQSDPRSAGVFDVAAIAEPTILFDPTAFEASLSLAAAPGWKLFGAGEGAKAPLAFGKPLKSAAKLVGDGTLHTAAVSATLTVHERNSRSKPIRLDFEKVLLPSINAWWILGPLECPADKPLAKVYPPEEKLDLKALFPGKDGERITWRKYERKIRPGDDLTSEFFVDFDEVFGKRVNDTIVYGFTYLDAPEDMDATLAFGSDDGVAIWLNDREVYRLDIGRPYSAKSDHVAVKLQKGANTLLVKVHQGGGDGGFGVHIEDAHGRPLTQVKPYLTP